MIIARIFVLLNIIIISNSDAIAVSEFEIRTFTSKLSLTERNHTEDNNTLSFIDAIHYEDGAVFTSDNSTFDLSILDFLVNTTDSALLQTLLLSFGFSDLSVPLIDFEIFECDQVEKEGTLMYNNKLNCIGVKIDLSSQLLLYHFPELNLEVYEKIFRLEEKRTSFKKLSNVNLFQFKTEHYRNCSVSVFNLNREKDYAFIFNPTNPTNDSASWFKLRRPFYVYLSYTNILSHFSPYGINVNESFKISNILNPMILYNNRKSIGVSFVFYVTALPGEDILNYASWKKGKSLYRRDPEVKLLYPLLKIKFEDCENRELFYIYIENSLNFDFIPIDHTKSFFNCANEVSMPNYFFFYLSRSCLMSQISITLYLLRIDNNFEFSFNDRRFLQRPINLDSLASLGSQYYTTGNQEIKCMIKK